MGQMSSQRIRYLQTTDGIRLAWADAGTGAAVVKASNWLTHLEYEWESPIWRHWMRFFSAHFRFVRYDERGCGMTDWNVGDLSFERRIADFEAVVEAANLRAPFTLLGISQGAAVCVAYAVRGLGNADIGARLSISEKTVRNHVSNLFDKLGVWSRAQAMVFARDHRFSAQEGHR